MATILVTGGAGFIGSHTCEALLARGDSVVCVDNLDELLYPKTNKLKNLQLLSASKGFTSYTADITDLPALEKVFSKHTFDGVIHIAALAGVRPSVENPFLYDKVNIGGTLNLLELCVKHKIKRFIFASSSSVYGERSKVPFREDDTADRPASQYAATKRACELYCATYSHLYGIRCSCLRFFTVYGPRGRPDMATWKFTEGILRKPPVVVYGDGSIRRDMTYVTDIVSGITAALDLAPRFEIFNLGDNRPISMKELINVIEKITGKKATIDYKPGKPEDMPLTYADISKAKEVLGYQPKISVEEGVRRFVEWYQKQ